MSFIFSRAMVEEFSQVNCSGIDAFAPLNLIPTPKPSLLRDKTMEQCLTRKDGRDRTYDRLDHFVFATESGPLNPDWVEWLMGFPIGHTGLKALETDKYHEWRQQHSPSYRAKAA